MKVTKVKFTIKKGRETRYDHIAPGECDCYYCSGLRRVGKDAPHKGGSPGWSPNKKNGHDADYGEDIW